MWWILFSWLFSGAVQAEAQTLRGETATGTVVAITAENVLLETSAGQQELATKDLLALQLSTTEPAPAEQTTDTEATTLLELADGSKLRVRALRVANDSANITLAGGHAATVPLKAIQSLRIPDTAAAAIAREDAEWKKITALDRSADLLVVRKKNVLDYLEGEIGAITDEAVEFTVDGEVIPVKWSRVAGLIYFRTPAELPPPRCVATDRQGSIWQISELAMANDTVTAKTPSGLQMERPLAAFDRFDFSHGKIQYLSDLSPESVTWTPYLGTATTSPRLSEYFAPKLDRGFSGQPITIDGRQFKKGLAIHSRTELVYRLPQKITSFEATAGLDDLVAPHGDVELIIFGDDRELYRGTFKGPAAPQNIRLDLQGVNRLKLVVDYGGSRDDSDHLDLAEARIIK